jgi:uncharacterized protein (DUF433 family)
LDGSDHAHPARAEVPRALSCDLASVRRSRYIPCMVTVHGPIHSDPDTLSGTPCFAGTRVPIATLMDYLKAGDRLDDFLDDFPTVKRDQAVAVLEIADRAVTDHARSA